MKRHSGEEYADLREYANHLRAGRKVSELSIYQRLNYLRRLRVAYDKPLRDLSAQEIESWLAGLNLAPTSHRTILVYLRHALKVLNDGDTPRLAKRLPKPKRGAAMVSRVRVPGELLTEEQIRDLMMAFPSKDLSAITALLYGLGARPSDVLELKRDDLQLKKEGQTPYLEAQILDSKGHPRVAYTAKPWVIQTVQMWLEAHPGGDLLFPSPRGGRRTPEGYRKALKRAAKQVGLKLRIYPYLLRHVRATELYDAPPAVRDAQMGWTPGSKMWANYTHLKPEKVREAILKREGVEAVRTELEAKMEVTTELVMDALLEIAQDPEQAARFRELLEQEGG
ncbi:MAG: tyrosine-type recombinase/integrase [Thermoplasmata archaeon]